MHRSLWPSRQSHHAGLYLRPIPLDPIVLYCSRYCLPTIAFHVTVKTLFDTATEVI